MKLIISLLGLCLVSGSRGGLVKMEQCGPDETACPGGCCPMANWYCCPEWYCAATAADCAFLDKRTELGREWFNEQPLRDVLR